jgi:hypothetical protein
MVVYTFLGMSPSLYVLSRFVCILLMLYTFTHCYLKKGKPTEVSWGGSMCLLFINDISSLDEFFVIRKVTTISFGAKHGWALQIS